MAQSTGENSWGFILGERPRPPASYGAFQELMDRVRVDVGEFNYAAPLALDAVQIPPDPIVAPPRASTANSELALRAASRRLGAADCMTDITDLLATISSSGRRAKIYEAPLVKWYESDTLSFFMSGLRQFYGLRTGAHCLRNDLAFDPYGTNVYVTPRVETRRLALIEGAKIAWDARSRPYVARSVEAAVVEDRVALMGILHEFSLAERLRIDALLEFWKVPRGQRQVVRQRASRRTVQADKNVWQLFRRSYTPAVRIGHALGRLAYPPDWFMSPKGKGLT